MRIQIFRVTVANDTALAAALVGDRMVQAGVPLARLAEYATQDEQRLALAEAIRAQIGAAAPTAAELVRLAGIVDVA